jgi:transcriptional antiterminator RfaH
MIATRGNRGRMCGAASAEFGPREGRRWYAVQCLSNRETGAAAHLENQDFPVFLPRRRKTRRHARRIETVLAPFFPGYLFVTLDLSRDRWRSVNGTYGVARLVMQGEAPAPVPAGVVEGLQQCCDDEGAIHWQGEIKPGQRVQIVDGALTELVGQLERLDSLGRVRVLLDILGRQTPILLPRESIVSAEGAH